MAITQDRLASLIGEADRMERAYLQFREKIEELVRMEQKEPGTREAMLTMLQYTLDANPVPHLPRRDVEKHHFFLTRKQNERKKLHARRRRGGIAQQEIRDREVRLKDDLDFFKSPPEGEPEAPDLPICRRGISSPRYRGHHLAPGDFQHGQTFTICSIWNWR
jgi:hypothetical protein